jgi:hypothetical protein
MVCMWPCDWEGMKKGTDRTKTWLVQPRNLMYTSIIGWPVNSFICQVLSTATLGSYKQLPPGHNLPQATKPYNYLVWTRQKQVSSTSLSFREGLIWAISHLEKSGWLWIVHVLFVITSVPEYKILSFLKKLIFRNEISKLVLVYWILVTEKKTSPFEL